MSEGTEEQETTAKGTKGKKEKAGGSGGFPLIPVMLAMVVSAVVAVGAAGGGVFLLVKSGRLPLGGGPLKVEAAGKAEPPPHRQIALDPLLVNLADGDGRSYLRVAITLVVEDPPLDKDAKAKKGKEEAPAKGKPVNEHEAQERDAALGVLGRATAAELLAPDGKEHLKDELRAAFTAKVPETKVTDVLLTEFLVQR